MNDELRELRRRVHGLEHRVHQLERENAQFHTKRPADSTHHKSEKGERIVAELIGGKMVNDSFDVLTPSGHRLEVRYAGLSTAVWGKATKRWTWNFILGAYKEKDFDRVILVGEVDPRYRCKYRDPTFPYIFFDVPKSRLAEVMGASPHIYLSTNPKKVYGFKSYGFSADPLYNSFQTTAAELKAKYGARH